MEMQKQLDIIKNIKDNLGASTGVNFESKVHHVLGRYYTYIGKKFSKHGSAGGDGGNDGWIEEDQLFYQIYGPQQKSSRSLKSAIHKKFENDLESLFDSLENNQWNGIISKYIFIVNTQDQHLPQDKDGHIVNVTKKLQDNYQLFPECQLTNVDYITGLLESVHDEEVLTRLSYDLQSPIFDKRKYELTVADLVNFLEALSAKIPSKSIDRPTVFERISLSYKIEINDLQSIKSQILIIHSKLNEVQKAVNIINDPIEIFSDIVKYIVEIYKSALLKNRTGIDAYLHIIEVISSLFTKNENYSNHVEYILVYIIDRCDIFERQ